MKAPAYTYETCGLALLANLDNLEIIAGSKAKAERCGAPWILLYKRDLF